jgi:hypothetical protein
MNYPQLLALFKETHRELQQRAARSVDTSLVIRNWLFGWYIVEFEQGGAERAELYGKSLINRLSSELKSFGLKGVSPTSLKQCRIFYLAYKKIGQALPDQSFDARIALLEIQLAQPVTSFDATLNAPKMLRDLTATLAGSFSLGWTHYVALLTISNADERRFYESESWSAGLCLMLALFFAFGGWPDKVRLLHKKEKIVRQGFFGNRKGLNFMKRQRPA